MKKKLVQCVIGFLLLAAGIFFAFEGSMLGERTLVIAIVGGAIGLLLIVTSKCRKLKK